MNAVDTQVDTNEGRSADGWPAGFDPHQEAALIHLPNGRVYLVQRNGEWRRRRDLEGKPEAKRSAA
jgi:hypothetical protein